MPALPNCASPKHELWIWTIWWSEKTVITWFWTTTYYSFSVHFFAKVYNYVYLLIECCQLWIRFLSLNSVLRMRSWSTHAVHGWKTKHNMNVQDFKICEKQRLEQRPTRVCKTENKGPTTRHGSHHFKWVKSTSTKIVNVFVGLA